MQSDPGEVLIAANPKSGSKSSASQVGQLAEACSESGLIADVVTSLDEVQQRAEGLYAEGRLRAVVSAGGDGTADALANLLPAHIPICLFPMGTENLLAKHFGYTNDVRSARDTLLHGKHLQMDVGSANGTIFLVMLSCGFDAEVVNHMHATRKGHINRWSYTRPILNTVARYKFPQIPFQTDATEEIQEAAWIFVFNVPRYAANMQFCPQADPHDGALDVCTFQRGGICFGMGYLSRLYMQSHQSMAGFSHQKCSKLTIQQPIAGSAGQHADIAFQIDGDPGGKLPITVEVLPNRLTLIVPNKN